MKNNPILIAICAVAGVVVATVLGTSISHIGTTEIHQPVVQDTNVVHKPEFDQFQQRVIDRLDDIKDVQHVMQEDIKAIKNGN